MSDFQKEEDDRTLLSRIYRAGVEAERKSFGDLVDNFYELESYFADYYINCLSIKALSISLPHLYNKVAEKKANMGAIDASIGAHECLKWLSGKKPNSIVYVSFGSLTDFNDSQLMEIAMSFESSGHDFIWVVNKEKKGKVGDENGG